MFEDLKPHIADLRKRLVISTITVAVMFFVCFSYYEPILNWMMVPVQSSLPANSQMVAVEIQETFFTALQVSFFANRILEDSKIKRNSLFFINISLPLIFIKTMNCIN
jgi:sec-independent protein translocase protein TatC